jgi:thiol-disulfide isomerase/thioredoxin
MKRSTIILIIILASIGLFFWSRYGRAQNIAFEEVKVTDLNGEYAMLSSLVKGPTIVHFYASWCGPCMNELPHLIEYAKTAGEPYNIVLVTDDQASKLHRVIMQCEGNASVRRVESLKGMGIYSIPATYFINADGEIVDKTLGEQDWLNPTYQSEVVEILKEK